MQKRYTFKIIFSVSTVLFLGLINAQTPVLIAPYNAPVESGALSEYSGRLGIGIAQPTVKLDVSGAGKFTSTLEAQKLKLTNGEIDGSGTLYLSPTGSGSIKVTIAANANVGIGQSNTFSNAANNLIVGTTNVLSSTASHHFITGISNEASGLFGFSHGYGNDINAGVLAGFNYAMGKENTINFNQTIALNGFNYALGLENEINSYSASGANYLLGAKNYVNYNGGSNEAQTAGLNYIMGLENVIDVNQSGSSQNGIGLNFIAGSGNKITGTSIGCFQTGVNLKSDNALGTFTFGIGDYANNQPLINNHPFSLMVGFGPKSTLFVKDNYVGINTTANNDAALRITSKNGGGTKLDLQAKGSKGWQNQIRFVDSVNNFRHLIVDNLDSNYLEIMPGYWNGGNPVATNILKVDGRVKIGNVKTPFTAASNYMLYVEKGILTERVKCAVKATADWSDFVFDENYKLQSLEEVAAFIKFNKHLPDVPSAQEMVENGLDVTQMNALLLRKIEELTLHVISLEQKIKKQ